jgi:hypothetical protein
MTQGIHIDENPSFILKPGARIIIPPNTTQYFARPRRFIGTQMLQRVAFLQLAPKTDGDHVLFRFSLRPTSRGLRFFLPDDLKVGDAVRVIWREERSAAAVREDLYRVYCAYFGDGAEPQADPIREAWD